MAEKEWSEKSNADLLALVEARFEKSMTIPEVFFTAEAGRIAEACWAMARRFPPGGRLLAFGNGAWATDARRVAAICTSGDCWQTRITGAGPDQR